MILRNNQESSDGSFGVKTNVICPQSSPEQLVFNQKYTELYIHLYSIVFLKLFFFEDLNFKSERLKPHFFQEDLTCSFLDVQVSTDGFWRLIQRRSVIQTFISQL